MGKLKKGTNLKKTHEEYVEEVINLNNGIKVIGNYVNAKTKILHECKHSHQWESSPNKILSGRECPYCKGVKVCLDNCLATLYPEIASEWHPTKNGELTPFNFTCGSSNKIWWVCTKGHEWKTGIANRTNGNGCPECCTYGVENRTKTHEKFKENIVEIYGDVYDFLTEYRNAKEKIKTLHKKCGYIWDAYPTVLLNDNGESCPFCNGKIRYDTKLFKERIFNLVGNEYKVLGKYVNSKTKIKMKHNICGYEWELSPINFTYGSTRCPLCNESKGEKRISKWFKENNLIFNFQKEFNGLIGLGGGNLSYDFYLPQYNLLIEFQGKQHEKYIDGMHEDENAFKKQQEHDKRKRQYAKDNGIKLLEIWYWDFDNIESILNEKLI